LENQQTYLIVREMLEEKLPKPETVIGVYMTVYIITNKRKRDKTLSLTPW